MTYVLQPLVRETYYDAQGRRVSVEYGDRFCTDPSDPSTCPDFDVATGTTESYSYDSRQRLARKRAVRSDGLVLLDYRYTYDSASNIVRIDDDRLPCWVAGETSIAPVDACPAPGPDVGRFVTYDITYSYDALYRLTEADPLYKLPEPDRVQTQTWSFDALGSMLTWDDTVGHFYGWSLGDIANGLQMAGDPGLGPLPESPSCPGGREDILGQCATDRGGVVAPHALYEARSRDGVDELRAYYDAAGNMAALVVHRPTGCDRENASGGPDGNGCKEGPEFALFFAWDEVGNLLAADRRMPTVADAGDPSPGADCSLDPSPEDFLGAGLGQIVWWCPVARVENSYDFGNQRRVKSETYFDGNPFDMPEGYSLYVSGNFEVRDADLSGGAFSGMYSRYARDGLGTSWELDAEGVAGTDRGKSRLTLTNHLSSVGVVLDGDAGDVAKTFSQLPYGAEENVLSAGWLDSADVGRYEFTGKERDRGVGSVYIGARFLCTGLGRWLSPDPLVLRAQGPLPGNENLFAYAANVASSKTDPGGLYVYLVVYDATEQKRTPAGAQVAGAAHWREAAIQQQPGFDPARDRVVVRGATSTDDLDEAYAEAAAATESGFGPVRTVDWYMHGYAANFLPQIGAQDVTPEVVERLPQLQYEDVEYQGPEPGRVAPTRLHVCYGGKGPIPDTLAQSQRSAVEATSLVGYASASPTEYVPVTGVTGPVYYEPFRVGDNIGAESGATGIIRAAWDWVVETLVDVGAVDAGGAPAPYEVFLPHGLRRPGGWSPEMGAGGADSSQKGAAWAGTDRPK